MRQSKKKENAVNSTTLVTEICEINKNENQDLDLYWISYLN